MRNGKLVNILTSEIVKGDSILDQAGDKVPVDGLLFDGKIKVSQAALNGESRDETKSATTTMEEAESTDYASACKIFMGSVVTSGEGYMVATLIGDDSELGKINKALTDDDEEEEEDDEAAAPSPEELAGMDFEELEDVCDDHSLDVDPDDYEEEDIEKFRKAIAKELGITLPKAKKETKAKGKKGKK